jgi:hypothetical protein
MSDDPFVHDDAAYVLGALGPAQRRAFEEHLQQCPDCTRRVSDIAGLPGLLAQLDESAFTGPEDVPPVPETLLPQLLRAVRRRRWRVRLLTVAAAAVAVVLAVLVAWAVIPTGTVPAPEAVAPVPARTMTQVDQDRLTATVAMQKVAWGTRVHLTCTYVGDDYSAEDVAPSYALVVHTRDGASQQVATWRAVPGRTTQLDAATDADPAQIASVDVVVTQTGRRVLTLG